MKNEVNRAFMAEKKRIYSSPLTEVTTYGSMNSIMITSIGMEGNNMPAEPGKNSAPKKHLTPVF